MPTAACIANVAQYSHTTQLHLLKTKNNVQNTEILAVTGGVVVVGTIPAELGVIIFLDVALSVLDCKAVD